MKTKSIFFMATIIALSCTSCARNFYQIYQADPTSNTINDRLISENQDYTITYNLWDNGGNFGFIFHNKTDQNIYVNMKETFFIQNGIAHNYFQDRTFSNSNDNRLSSSHSVSAAGYTGFNSFWNLLQGSKKTTVSSSSSQGVTFKEEEIVCIPAHTSKTFSEYNIVNNIYRDCDLSRYPKKKEIRTKRFSKFDTPYIFSNRIVYTKGESDSNIKHNIEHEFYVSAITNYREKDIIKIEQDSFCGEKGENIEVFTINQTSNKFYLKYDNKGGGYRKH
mgnify:CR=1 FL=1